MIAVLGLGIAAGVAAGLPYWDIPSFNIAWPLNKIGLTAHHLDLQPFGMIVAIGVLTGAWLMRKYAEKRGVDDDDLRGVLGWTTVCGFAGAHLFDVLMYQQDKLVSDPLILLKVWDGISSYGGFLGGSMGFCFYIWWKRLTFGMWGDATGIGLLVAFSIGRIGCTIVHDHIGHATSFAMGFDYPRGALEVRHILHDFGEAAQTAPVTRAHNLGFYELLYLIPVNATILWLGFKAKPRPAGFLLALMGAVYAPVRFFLEFLRLNDTDPRYLGFTFAQWCSVGALAVCLYAIYRTFKYGKIAPFADELDGKVGGRLATHAVIAVQGKKSETKDAGNKPEAKDGKDAGKGSRDTKETVPIAKTAAVKEAGKGKKKPDKTKTLGDRPSNKKDD